MTKRCDKNPNDNGRKWENSSMTPLQFSSGPPNKQLKARNLQQSRMMVYILESRLYGKQTSKQILSVKEGRRYTECLTQPPSHDKAESLTHTLPLMKVVLLKITKHQVRFYWPALINTDIVWNLLKCVYLHSSQSFVFNEGFGSYLCNLVLLQPPAITKHCSYWITIVMPLK